MRYSPGEVVLIATESAKTKKIVKRPVFILYANDDTLIACGVSRSNKHKGVELTADDGAIKNCRILLHYMFILSPDIVIKKLFTVHRSKKKEIYKKLKQKIQLLR